MLSRTTRSALCRACAGAGTSGMLPAGKKAAHRLLPQSRRRNSSTTVPVFQPRTNGLAPHHGPRDKITHTCSALSASAAGIEVVLGGWVSSQRRASSNLHFFTLRDHTGSVQLITKDEKAAERLISVPIESVVQVKGVVKERKAKAKEVANGADEVEIEVSEAILLNPAQEPLPFYPNRGPLANEDVRAQHRYLDLRRTELTENIKLRSKVAHIFRTYLHDNGFTEVETPVLLNSTPEGAREFLVPTRLSSSSTTPAFYALQQSPQQPKQLLIASGAVDKYYQLARCFRDEDGRKDRQPEFTQVDLEMAFVSGGAEPVPGKKDMWGIGGRDVKETVEGVIRKIWKEVKGVELGEFRVMPYQVAMDVYGSDKPDTRFESYTLPIGYYPGLSDSDIDKILLDKSAFTVEWMVTRSADLKYLDIKALTANNNYIDYVRITRDNLNSWVKESPLTQTMGLELSGEGAVANVDLEPGDVIWVAQRKKIAEGGWTHLGRLRVQIADILAAKGSLDLPTQPHFLWVTEFPLFTKADEDKEFLAKGRWASSHHPFTAPMYEDLDALKQGEVDRVRGQHYDLVLNGQEIGGGSVRIHDADLQEYIMRDILKLEHQEIARFSHLLHALKFGAPPHGGIALGFDRLIAILAGAKSIRDIIAFPKSTSGVDPVFKSPSATTDEVLRGYGLKALQEGKAGNLRTEEN